MPVTGLLTPALQSTTATIETPDDQFVNVSADVQMWERALLPLRTDPSSAATVVDNQNVFVNVQRAGSGDVPVNRQRLFIYGSDAEIPIHFRSVIGAGTDQFAGEDVQLLVAKVDDADATSPSMTSDDFSEAIDRPMNLVGEQRNNEDVTYELIDAGSLDSDGSASLTYDLAENDRGAGQYVFFLVANGDDGEGFSVDSSTGNLSVTGDATVLGFDAATAHQRTSDAEPAASSVQPGENVTFSVSESTTDSEVAHTVVLYNDSTFRDSQTYVTVNGSLDDGVSNQEVSVERSIDEVNGVANRMADGATTDERAVRSTDFGELIETIESNSSVRIGDSDTDEHVVLDASMTQTTTPSGSIRVQTLDNWSAGDYQWIHVAVAENGSVVSSATGSVAVGESDGGDGSAGNDGGSGNDGTNGGSGSSGGPTGGSGSSGGPTGGSGSSGGPMGSSGDGPSAPDGTDDVSSNIVVSSSSPESVESRIGRTQANEQYDISFDDDSPESNGVTLSGLTVKTRESGQDLSISASLVENLPADIPQPPTPTAGIINIETNVPETSIANGTFHFSVSRERLDELGLSPDNVTLYRYHDGEWRALDTRHVDGNRFTAETPGFSYFAIGSSGTSAFSVTEVSLDRTDVSAGESVTVSATVENTGSASGSKLLELLVDGESIASREVELDAGESTTVEFTHAFAEAGSYELAVSGADGVRVSVNPADDSGEDGENAVETTAVGPDGGGTNWFLLVGVLAVIAVALAGGYVYYQRSDDDRRPR